MIDIFRIFLERTCPVHEGELASLPDGTPIRVEMLATELNLNHVGNCFEDFDLETALRAALAINRNPADARIKNITEYDLRRPIILMATVENQFVLIDGACRVLHAKNLGRRTIPAYLVHESSVRIATLKIDRPADSEDPRISATEELARVSKLTMAATGTRVQTRTGKDKTEVALGPAKPPQGEASSDRNYLSISHVEDKVDGGFERRGKDSFEVTLIAAVARLTHVLLACAKAANAKFEKRNYLANLPFGPLDTDLRERTPEEQQRRKLLDQFFPGMKFLPRPRVVINEFNDLRSSEIPSIQELTGVDENAKRFDGMTPAQKLEEAERLVLPILSTLGIMLKRAGFLAYIGPQVQRDAKRRQTLDPDQIRAFHTSGDPTPELDTLMDAAFLSGMIPQVLYPSLSAFHAPMQWAVVAGLMKRGKPGFVTPPMAWCFLAAFEMSHGKFVNNYTPLWQKAFKMIDCSIPKASLFNACFTAVKDNSTIYFDQSVAP